MRNLLMKTPVPLAGLMLGAVSLGNLQRQLGYQKIGDFFVAIACFFVALLIIKMMVYPKLVLRDLANPVVASVFPTFFMGILVLSHIFQLGAVWWLIAIIQVSYVLYFTIRFVWRVQAKIDDVLPSWFIVYAGIGVIPVTAGDFSTHFATVMWWLALTGFVVLLPLVLARIFIRKNLPQPITPLITILTAPAALCLTGYLQHFPQPNKVFVCCAVVLSQILYITVLCKLVTLIKLPFYPSYAAFTFPLVITATSMNGVAQLLDSDFLHDVFLVEGMLATIMVVYVVIRYSLFLTANEEG